MHYFSFGVPLFSIYKATQGTKNILIVYYGMSQGMMLNLIRYNKPSTSKMLDRNGGSPLERGRVEKRIEVLTEACEGNSSLLKEVEKLKSSL